MKICHKKLLSALMVALVFGIETNTWAQSISLSTVSTTPDNPENFDLQGTGTTDWVQFGTDGVTDGFNLTNEKSGGSVDGVDTVGAVTVSNDPLGGRTQTTAPIFLNYANGTSPAHSSTLVNGAAAGSWSIQTNYSGDSNPASENGATLSFTIDFNKAISSGTISVVANSYGASSALFTAALNNGTPFSSSVGFDNGNQNDIFTLDLSDITAGSSLTFNWEMISGGAPFNDPAFDNVSLAGVALNLTEAPAPEPSTWAMSVLGVAAFLLVRRIARVRSI